MPLHEGHPRVAQGVTAGALRMKAEAARRVAHNISYYVKWSEGTELARVLPRLARWTLTYFTGSGKTRDRRHFAVGAYCEVLSGATRRAAGATARRTRPCPALCSGRVGGNRQAGAAHAKIENRLYFDACAVTAENDSRDAELCSLRRLRLLRLAFHRGPHPAYVLTWRRAV